MVFRKEIKKETEIKLSQLLIKFSDPSENMFTVDIRKNNDILQVYQILTLK